jgi:hypothetical protein
LAVFRLTASLHHFLQGGPVDFDFGADSFQGRAQFSAMIAGADPSSELDSARRTR